MSLNNINTILFRVLSDPNYIAPKGSELTWLELDGNLKIIADAITELGQVDTSGIDVFNPSDEYSLNGIVVYNGNVWKYINAIPQTGITPGTDSLTWEISSSGILSHQRNKDEYLDFGGANQISAADIIAGLAAIAVGPFLQLDGSLPMAGELDMDGYSINKVARLQSDITNGEVGVEMGPGGSYLFAYENVGGYYTEIQADPNGGFRLEFISASGSGKILMTAAGLFITNTTGFSGLLDFSALTANRTITFQNKNYTGVADLTDIPTVAGVYALLAGAVFTGNVNGITPTELGYLTGITSSVQTQINGKQAALVSLANIRTVNGSTLLGSTNLVVGDAILSATQTFTGFVAFSNGSFSAGNGVLTIGSGRVTARNIFPDLTTRSLGDTAAIWLNGHIATVFNTTLKTLKSGGSPSVAGDYLDSVTSVSTGIVTFGAGFTGVQLGVTGGTIGCYGVTPVVRPTTAITAGSFVANAGTAVNSASTFNGYTLAQISAALNSLGLLT